MGRPTCSISLGGLNDVAVLTGHSYSYESATYGQLAQKLIDCNSTSPVIVFDEVDKISDFGRAQEIIALLIHLTDPASNREIHDRYFQNIPLDFSRACLVFTMNDTSRVSPVLLDRLTMVQMSRPSIEDKVQIAQNFLIPRELKRLHSDLCFCEDAVRDVVAAYSANECGVRNLARGIRHVVETMNVARRGAGASLQIPSLTSSPTISCRTVDKILPTSRNSLNAQTHMLMYN